METPSGAGTEGVRRGRRGPSLGALVVLAIGVVGLLVGGVWGPQIRAYWLLRPWSHQGLAAAAKKVGDAIAARDASALRGLVNTTHLALVEQDGKLVALQAKPGFNQEPAPMPAEWLTPTQPAADGEFHYSMPPSDSRAAVVLQAGTDYKVVYIFSPAHGHWVLDEAMYIPANGKRGVHWQF